MKILCAVNVLSFCAIGIDKYYAVNNQKRIAEKTLHALTLFGGSPGTIMGMYVFKHKTKKMKFLAVTGAIILLQIFLIYKLLLKF